ncbi:GntR family transcriptional regulator [Klebsiella quasipneumoniae]|uniref:GntR family transcriptional regulator n=1 Tax=Klebsiella quasipneumoniae TaxID=1463165 RepID=UPI000E4BE78E|nr:GntR family transcriptional regulator [Klebsiella quasipneumoniae]MBX8478376.1 GntR family transcriptional regulator [Klebsiella quasipneumoniae subsp. similipneumoniae]MBX9412485.1 GntR family transcriptional regulator [Klebsiella quasipneumoniae subsp. similipneumoniae]MBX9418708.1 GntR family transcriptional regulator [Klebsiella quasipneumoniae subsp. similipneumoniae]MDQ9151201.1 GntR family transcriptional regulator [Klebsiella quasipneumoniae subsp. quasipneumoniae]QQD66938.1 GntR fa
MNAATRSTADILASELKILINKGALRDGDRLVERDLACQFSVSRIPMREAIQQLEREGLVEIFRNRGAVVKTLTAADVDEIYQLRALLEGEAIFHSLENMDPETLARAELVHQLLSSASEPELQWRYNREFHELLYRKCNNQRLLKMIGELREQIERYELFQNRLLSDTLKFQDEHQQILMACQQNNPQEARAYTVKHILSAGEILRAYIVSR